MDALTLSLSSNQKFSDVRGQAFYRSVLHFLKGEPDKLLSFDKVQTMLKLNHTHYLGLQNVELDKIVGSVGRYEDFTREFLPKRDSNEFRWRRIYDLSEAQEGIPPIELYKVGEAYFVRDGNHRVSVARANGLPSIEAFVTEYASPVDVSPGDTMDQILIKIGAANFLQNTRLNELRPEQDIQLTNPGRYKFLLEHIAVHKYLKEVESGHEISDDESVTSWYDNVYMPVINEIRERDILKYFPGRTEADLYAWIILHRAALEDVYGLGQVDTDEVVDNLEEAALASPLKKLGRAIARAFQPAEALPALP